mmetsp:Transcript_16791/g.48353  ORF Transcript_16791/g.48353 Transcript_16791/m.48353 type:complete len:248 (-) Transcript_16791:1066-1809(-)
MESEAQPRFDAVDGDHPEYAHDVALHVGLVVIGEVGEYAVDGYREAQEYEGAGREPRDQVRVGPVQFELPRVPDHAGDGGQYRTPEQHPGQKVHGRQRRAQDAVEAVAEVIVPVAQRAEGSEEGALVPSGGDGPPPGPGGGSRRIHRPPRAGISADEPERSPRPPHPPPRGRRADAGSRSRASASDVTVLPRSRRGRRSGEGRHERTEEVQVQVQVVVVLRRIVRRILHRGHRHRSQTVRRPEGFRR